MTYSPRLLVAFSMLAACNSGGSDDGPPRTPDAPMASTNATFQWTITRSGVPVTCAEGGVDEVRIEATAEATGLPINHTFQCVLTPGTLALPADRYAISAQLYDGRGPQMRAFVPAQPLIVPQSGTAPAMTFDFVLAF